MKQQQQPQSRGECVHCWRPLANEIKLPWKCALTIRAKAVIAT